jgi:hypothetical protein
MKQLQIANACGCWRFIFTQRFFATFAKKEMVSSYLTALKS